MQPSRLDPREQPSSPNCHDPKHRRPTPSPTHPTHPPSKPNHHPKAKRRRPTPSPTHPRSEPNQHDPKPKQRRPRSSPADPGDPWSRQKDPSLRHRRPRSIRRSRGRRSGPTRKNWAFCRSAEPSRRWVPRAPRTIRGRLCAERNQSPPDHRGRHRPSPWPTCWDQSPRGRTRLARQFRGARISPAGGCSRSNGRCSRPNGLRPDRLGNPQSEPNPQTSPLQQSDPPQ
jgi:hypothetical protein